MAASNRNICRKDFKFGERLTGKADANAERK